VSTPTGARIKVRARVTEAVDRSTVFIPFHFAGHWQGKDLRQYYPEGAAPIVLGEAVNTATTYGYDAVTMMQETKPPSANSNAPDAPSRSTETIPMARMKFICDAERCINCNGCVTACKTRTRCPGA
jgi:Molydopterin dinucleotide binding domain.